MFNNRKLQEIFSTIHQGLITCYKSMNSRLPTGPGQEAHFWAEPSRELIWYIYILRSLERTLNNTVYAFYLDSYYEDVINKSEQFLSERGGSIIPPNMEKVVLYYTDPIILKMDSLVINSIADSQAYAELQLIGEGSYAKVFSYYDPMMLYK